MIKFIPSIFILLSTLNIVLLFTTTIDKGCNEEMNVKYAVLIALRNVNKMLNICTGGIISAYFVVTTGWCCHSARQLHVFAFYDFNLKRWTQKANVLNTNIFARNPDILPSNYLCVLTLDTKLDLSRINNKVELFNGSISEDFTLDVISILYNREENQFKITCRMAEFEKNTTCSHYYQVKFDNSTWLPCLTNTFNQNDSCDGADGAVIQYDNKILGIMKHYMENCGEAKYGFVHILRRSIRFLRMIISRGKDKDFKKEKFA